MSQKQQKPLADRFEICPELQPNIRVLLGATTRVTWRSCRGAEIDHYECKLIEEGKPCNRVNYDEQAYPWGLCISLPLQKDKEA